MELTLSVKKTKFRIDDPQKEHADAEFKEMRQPVLERDKSTCQYCGFKAKKWQEVHHIDNNHSNNKKENLVTACPLCHQVNHTGFAGMKQSGKLIFIYPELGIKQSQLNQIIRALWVAKRSGDTATSSHASGLLSRINKYSIVAHMKVGTCDPMVLAYFMMNNMTEEQYRKRGDIFKGIYLLPLEEAFEKQIKYWSESAFEKPSNWQKMAYQSLSSWVEDQQGKSKNKAILDFLEKENY